MKAHIVQSPMPCLTIDGRDYPLNLSVYATEVLGEKYGSLEKMGDALGELPDYKQLTALLEIFHLMMEQGAQRQNRRFLDRKLHPVPSIAKLKVKLGILDIDMLYNKLSEAIAGGAETSVETALKNAKTTQGKAV